MMLLQGHTGSVHCLAYSPDGSMLASGDDETVWLWDMATGYVKAAGQDRRAAVSCLAFSPDGRTLSSGDGDGLVYFREAKTAQIRVDYRARYCYGPSVHFSRVNAVSFIDGGRYLVSVAGAQDDQTGSWAAVWSLEPSGCLILEGLNPVWSLVSDSKGRMVYCSVGDCYLSGWNFGGHVFDIWADDRNLSDSNIHYMRALTHRPKTFPRSRTKPVAQIRSLALSSDGLTLAASWDRVVELWEVAESRLRVTLPEHDDGVSSMAFAPDGRTLASASRDGTVRLWDVDDARQRSCHNWEIGAVHGVAFAPDGMTMAAAGDSGIVVWDVDETA